MSDREAWLAGMVEALRDTFADAGHPLPKRLRVSCGWPSGRALATMRAVGQCWSPDNSEDGTTEIFVSPCVADAAEVAEILAHELCHAAVGVDKGHGPAFARCARAIGLTGPLRSTVAGETLRASLATLAARLGEYPHATLDTSKQKHQGTRMRKVACPACGYTVRTTARWIAVGLPTCACGQHMACADPQ
jgi:hypothetical protein